MALLVSDRQDLKISNITDESDCYMIKGLDPRKYNNLICIAPKNRTLKYLKQKNQ